MELEEMKRAWLALGEKLDQKGKLSDIIIREMYQTKVKKSVNTLLWYEGIGIIILLLVLPFIGWLLSVNADPLSRIVLVYWGIFSVTGVIWYSVKIALLMKMDEMGVIKDNVKSINTYAVWIHKEKKYLISLVVIGVLPIFVIYWLHAEPWLWIILIAWLTLAILATIWLYKRIYARNIRSIQQNLDELNDLKD